MIARSERILLAAQRGGVEVRRVRSALDSAVDAQIELETLVHTFTPKPVEVKQQEGLQFAQSALLAGQNALDELSYRRRGLFVALEAVLLYNFLQNAIVRTGRDIGLLVDEVIELLAAMPPAAPARLEPVEGGHARSA